MPAPTPAPDLALGWSGGKDSALALWTLRRERGEDPSVLVTTVTEGYERVSMHGVRRDLLRAQAEAVGVPLAEVAIPPECPNALYEQRMDPAQLEGGFAGRRFDEALLDDLPAGVDPCGENGEFHTFVHDGPIFRRAVACHTGEVVERGGFVFCDLLPGAA